MQSLSQQQRDELIRRYNESVEKRRYYLLAAAGAALGFIVTQTSELAPSKTLWILVSSLVLIGASIVFGLRALVLSSRQVKGIVLLSDLKPHPPTIGVPANVVKNFIRENQLEPMHRAEATWERMQIISVIVGSLLVPVWRISECSGCVLYLANSLRNLLP